MPRRHSHLRIGPGGLVYVVVTVLILGAAMYTQANLLFWAFGLMIGGLLVSLAMAWQVLRGVSVQRLPSSHGVAGEMLVLRYQLVNRGWLPVFGVIIHETWGRRSLFRAGWKRAGPISLKPPRLAGRPFGWVLHLGPHQTLQAEAPCWPLRRGELAFERVVISTSFPFGVIRKVVEFTQPVSVLVYPQLFRFNRRVLFKLSQIDPSGSKRVEKSGGNEEFFGLRDYRSGDNPRMIDWKHSARLGTLIAREMTQPSPPRIMLVLDLTNLPRTPTGTGKDRLGRRLKRQMRDAHMPMLSDDPIEQAISLAASLVCDAHFHGYQIGLAVLGVSAPTFHIHHSLPHRTRMLEVLSTLDITQTRTDPPAMPMPASVVIRPGAGDARRGIAPGSGAMVLGTAEMQQYVAAESIPSHVLLTRRPVRTSKRQDLAGV
jgi:uncharacterized protein (DUF58 family)